LQGRCLLLARGDVGAIADVHQRLNATDPSLWGWPEAVVLFELVEAYAKTGQPDRGLHLLSELMAQPHVEDFYEPQAFRLKGRLLAIQAPHEVEATEQCFRRAAAIALARQARSLELEATIDLARWLARAGRRAEARQALADVYGWFTEGFETSDLEEARALLHELAG
jgi:hypothetical protein